MVKNERGLWEIYKIGKKPERIGGEYASATLFEHGKALVAEHGKPIAIINKEGKVIKHLDKIDGKEVSKVSPFSEGYAIYEANGSYGIINEEGESVIPAKYCAISTCHDGKFVAIEDKYKEYVKFENVDSATKMAFSLLDTKGELVSNIKGSKYCFVGTPCDGRLPVCQKVDGEYLWGIIDYKQNVVVKPSVKLKGISAIQGDKFIYSNGSAWGVMDMDGKTIIRAKYDGLAFASDDKFIAYTKFPGNDDVKGRCKYIDSNDEQVGNDDYLLCSPFYMLDGKHAIAKITEGQWAVVNSKCKQMQEAPDMYNIVYILGDYSVENDSIDIPSMLSKLNLSQNGMGEMTFSDSPQEAIAKKQKYDRIEVVKSIFAAPDWYDDEREVNYGNTTDGAYVNFSAIFSDYLSRQTYRTKRVIDDVYSDFYYYHDERIPTGYVWNNVKIQKFKAVFGNSEILKGKLRMVFKALLEHFSTFGKIKEQSSGAAIIQLNNGKLAYIYMNPQDVTVEWGDMNADDLCVNEYEGATEELKQVKASDILDNIYWPEADDFSHLYFLTFYFFSH